MHRLRQSILSLLLLLSILLAIECLPYPDWGVPAVHAFVYLLVPAILLATIALPALLRVSTVAYHVVWIGAYLILKLALPDQDAAIAPNAVLASWLVEMAVIALTVLLARELAARLQDSDDVIENILMAGADAQVPRLNQAVDDIQKELIRSRRHHHSLSVILVEPEPGSIRVNLQRVVQLIQETVARRYLVAQIGLVLSGMLRRTDIIVESDSQGRFIILCPEIDVAASQNLLERIRAVVGKIGLKVTCGVRAFPDGAVTLGEVVEFAESPLISIPESVPAPAWHTIENQKASSVPVTRK